MTTKINEMSDSDRLAFFDGLCAVEHTSTIMKQTDAVKGLPGDLPTVAFTDLFEYGFQRRFNDGNGGAEVSTADKIANGRARWANHLKGVITARGPGVTPVESEMYRAARADYINGLPKGARKEARGLTRVDIKVHVDARIATDPDGYLARAEAMMIANEAARVAHAQALADCMNTITIAKADLAALESDPSAS